MKPFVEMTSEVARDALASAGFSVDAGEIRVEAREERWLARLPGERLAWFASSDRGVELLEKEGRVLALVGARCTFSTPRVVFADPGGAFQVRTMVAGSAEPFDVFGAVRGDPELARRVGASIGAMLAEQHTRIEESDVRGWLPARPAWPKRRSWILERLPRVVDDAGLVARCEAAITAYEAVEVDPADRALCHADLGFHNLGIDPETYVVHGAFDYEDAAWADRHHDLRYLVLHTEGEALLDGASSTYEAGGGRPIDRARVLLYNAACAITFLAFRAGSAPDDVSCGRKLSRDLAWTKAALAAVLG